MKTLVIAGSNSVNSINQEFAIKLAAANNYEYFDTRVLDIPLFNRDLIDNDQLPYDVQGFLDYIQPYNNIIIVSPEYNGSPAPSFKSLLDFESRVDREYFKGKNLVIVAVTPGKAGGSSVRKILTDMLFFTGANILGDVGIGNYEKENDYTDQFKEIDDILNGKQ